MKQKKIKNYYVKPADQFHTTNIIVDQTTILTTLIVDNIVQFVMPYIHKLYCDEFETYMFVNFTKINEVHKGTYSYYIYEITINFNDSNTEDKAHITDNTIKQIINELKVGIV